MMRNGLPDPTLTGFEQAATGQPVRSRTARTVPFDYVVTFPIVGRGGTRHQNIINVSSVGPFVVTAIGYSLLMDARFGYEVDDGLEHVPDPPTPIAVRSGDGLTIYGAPGARVVILLDGETDRELRLDEQGRSEIRVPEGKSLLLIDSSSERSSPILHFTRRRFPPQFGRTRPVPGTDRFEVAGTAGRRIYVELRGVRDGINGLLLSGKVTLPGSIISCTDAALQEAEKCGVDLTTIEGTGVRGRILKSDVVQLVNAEKTTGDRVPVQEAGIAQVRLADLNPSDALRGLEDGINDPNVLAELRKFARGDQILIRDAGPDENDKDACPHLAATYQIPASPRGLRLVDLPASALQHGFRLAPSVLEKLELGLEIPPEELPEPFELCGAGCGGFDFLYSIVDNATQRAFQSEPIHNVAGLGIANGDRPFRQLPKPIVFEPRSVIRFEIQEISGGPGTLYIVLQGYKVVGAEVGHRA